MRPEGLAPLPLKPRSGRGRKPTLLRRDARYQPLSAKALALQLPARQFRNVTWRDGSNTALSSRFATLRVRLAKLRWRTERDYQELKQELGLGDFEGRGWRDSPAKTASRDEPRRVRDRSCLWPPQRATAASRPTWQLHTMTTSPPQRLHTRAFRHAVPD